MNMSREIQELSLSSRLEQGIRKMGISQLTPIQVNAWNLMMNPEITDLIVHSETGSGKTLSYLLPLIEIMIRNSHLKAKTNSDESQKKITRKDGTTLLIVVPVRELAQQVLDVCRQVLRYIPFIICGIVTGGEKRVREKERLRKGQNILVATPGRLLDHVRTTQCLNLESLQFLVIDEADRTLDEGFEEDLRQLKIYLEEKQSYFGAHIQKKVLVSATLNERVTKLSYFILSDPKIVSSKNSLCDWNPSVRPKKTEDDKHKCLSAEKITVQHDGKNLPFLFPENLEQRFILCSPKRKVIAMFALLYWIFTREKTEGETKKAIVFSNSFSCVDFFAMIGPLLKNPFRKNKKTGEDEGLLEGVQFKKIHKEMSQVDRGSSRDSFVEASRAVLFCTDVAARGLHFDNVTDVIHFDAPLSVETYIHRTGRTARIGNKGTSHLLLYPHEQAYVDFLGQQGVNLAKRHTSILFYCLIKSDASQTSDLLDGEIILQKSYQRVVNSDKLTYQAGKNAFTGWRKSYSAYPVEQRTYFDSTLLHLQNISRSFGIDM